MSPDPSSSADRPPTDTTPVQTPRPPTRPMSGGRVVVSGLVGGTGGLAIAFFLRSLVANTPTRLSPSALFWSTVLVGGFGLLAGMAVEAVRQLRDRNPDPAYRHGRRGHR
ncbi:MAG: hypothetical protein ACK6BG_01890 [Cyanobacteriota bacterium]